MKRKTMFGKWMAGLRVGFHQGGVVGSGTSQEVPAILSTERVLPPEDVETKEEEGKLYVRYRLYGRWQAWYEVVPPRG